MSWGSAGRCRGAGGSAQRDAAAPRHPLQALSTDVVVLLPVLVLAEGAAVASGVAAAARLAGLSPAVPAALVRQWGENGPIKISLFFVSGHHGAFSEHKTRVCVQYCTVNDL